jgi:predicted metal-dependent hydrolase
MENEADNFDKDIKDAENLLNDTKEVVVEKTEEVQEIVAEKVEAVKIAETEVKTTEIVPEEVKEDDLPQGVRSHIGRIIKRQLKDENKGILNEIAEMKTLLKERITVPQVFEEMPVLPENPTAEEVTEFVEAREKILLKNIERQKTVTVNQEHEKKRIYASDYQKMIEETLDPDEDAEVYKLMTDTKDITYNQAFSLESGKYDAKQDFLINFRNATKSILNKTKTPVQSVVHGKKPNVPTGVNVPGATKVAVKQVDTSKWSPEEQQLAGIFTADELANMGI